jgi:hypothetical protein
MLRRSLEEREPYAEGDTLVGPAVTNALQILGQNITNSSNVTDVCCHLREAGANVSELWPWDCHDVHSCAVEVGFQVPLWAKVLIAFIVLVCVVVVGTVWYIRWDYARGLAIKQSALTGVGLSSPRSRPKRNKSKKRRAPGAASVADLADQGSAGASLADGTTRMTEQATSLQRSTSAELDDKKTLFTDGVTPVTEQAICVADSADSAKAVLTDGLSVVSSKVSALSGEVTAQVDSNETNAADSIAASSRGATEPEPEPEPEPECTVGWGKLDGWQYYPAQQHIFKGQVQDLEEMVRHLSADANRLKIRLGRPVYKSGMIDGQDQLLESCAKKQLKTEKLLKRRMRQIEQNCGAEVSGAQLDICHRRAYTNVDSLPSVCLGKLLC